NAVVDRTINASIADALRAAGLPKVRNFFSKPAERVLVTVPEKYFRVPDAEIDARFRYVGYLRWQSQENPALDDELREFTADVPGGRVPVLTFGSMVYENSGAWMERFIRAWPRDRKIIVQRGWADFPQFGEAAHVKILGKVSHDQLFQHASAIIHHGGAGTTASALHAGVPQIVVPHIGDQNFFGSEVERFGCGFRLKKNVWPEQLHHALDRLLADPVRVARAAAVRQDLLAEDGPARAVAELERYVAEHRRSA
ncbi:MAG: hypothetical protein H7067_05050, partial [Burkholderiales bacterium]|nr:hypothetical protein [Opitutaceae bacterium]